MSLVKLWRHHYQENEIEAQFNGTERRNALIVSNDDDDDNNDNDSNVASDDDKYNDSKNPTNENVNGEAKINIIRTSKQSSVTKVNEAAGLSVKVSIKCVLYCFFLNLILRFTTKTYFDRHFILFRTWLARKIVLWFNLFSLLSRFSTKLKT